MHRPELKESLLSGSSSTLKDQLLAGVGQYHSLLLSTQQGSTGAFAFFKLYLFNGAKPSSQLLQKLNQSNSERETLEIAKKIFNSSNDALKLSVALTMNETVGSKTIFSNLNELKKEAKSDESQWLITQAKNSLIPEPEFKSTRGAGPQ